MSKLLGVQDGNNGIWQRDYAELIAKTNMRKIEERVEEVGVAKWARKQVRTIC